MPLAVVYKETPAFQTQKPWKVHIAAAPDKGIIGGIMGPWKTRKAAQKWADEYNKIHDPLGK